MGLHCLKLIRNYLTNCKQRSRIKNSSSSWEDILFGVPQGSIWSASLFSIFLGDLFLVIDDIDVSSYADDNNIHCEGESIDFVILSLQYSVKRVFQ